MSVEIEAFGAAKEYTIRGNADLSVSVLSYGATIRSIRFHGTDLALGYETLEDYQRQGGYLGATVGRYANRIAGGKFTLNGREYDVGCNEPGRGHLHGGKTGLDKKFWRAELQGGHTVCMTAALEDGEEGYPGAMEIRVFFTVEGNTLRITYEATSSADTVFNPTNHTYFNLNGQDGAPVLNHLLQINAGAFTPVNEKLIPTGEILPVRKTPFDFTEPKPIGRDLRAAHPQLGICGGYDHNFVLSGEGLRLAAALYSPETGYAMECRTTCPGIQIYTANFLNTPCGKSGPMGQYQGICLETQFFPDSPNHPAFPSAVLKKDALFRSVTEYGFSKRK